MSRRRTGIRAAYAAIAVLLWATLYPAASPAGAASVTATSSHIDHVFLIVEENNGFSDVIGNPAAPNLNYLAQTFGVATDYFGLNGTSEPNYVGLLGGSTFGINSDDAYWTQLVHQPSLISQLDGAGITWKAYLQGLPHPDYQGICYPAKCNGAPDSDPLYVSKHDGIQNFTTSLNPFDWSHQVPVSQLSQDLASGAVPRFGYVVPDECHDMHGDPPYCLDSGNIGDPQNQHLVAFGDAYLGQLVSEITGASFWPQGNNVIAVTFDSGDNSAGCCDAHPGGGRVATIVITSHGPRGAKDATPSNHYSLLRTIQQTFGLGCLQFTCDTAKVQPLTPLVAVTGSPAIATHALGVPNYATPTPVPMEPTSQTTATASSGGWTVQPAGLLGTSDNSLGAVAGSSPSDVWAVGDYLPDTATSNQDATLAFAEHYDGKAWTAVPPPDTGPNFDSLYGVAASQGQAWAVGARLDSAYQDRALIEWWNGTSWSIAANPQPGSLRDLLFSASATSASDVWTVGDQEGANGVFETLAEHWDGTSWTVVHTPDPGSTGNHLYGVDAVSPHDVWAVGQQLGATAPDQALVEHWDGKRWSVVASPVSTSASVLLQGVAATPDGRAWAVGEADGPSGGRPVIETYQAGGWQFATLPSSAGSNWTSLYGVAVAGSGVWAVGTFVDPVSDNNETLVLHDDGSSWTVDHGPNPGTGSNILGGIATVGNHLFATGVYDNGGSTQPLIERR